MKSADNCIKIQVLLVGFRGCFIFKCHWTHMCECVCVCMHVFISACMYEYIYVCTYVPSRGPVLDEPLTVVSYKTACQCIHSTYVKSSFCFFVTSHCRHILSRGSSFLRAVDCIIAVRKDWGLKKPDNHTDDGSWKKITTFKYLRTIRIQNADT